MILQEQLRLSLLLIELQKAFREVDVERAEAVNALSRIRSCLFGTKVTNLPPQRLATEVERIISAIDDLFEHVMGRDAVMPWDTLDALAALKAGYGRVNDDVLADVYRTLYPGNPVPTDGLALRGDIIQAVRRAA